MAPSLNNYKKWIRRYAVLAIIVALWLIVGAADVVTKGIYDSGCLILAALLFAAALPISLLMRMDELFNQFGVGSFNLALPLALVYVAVNFALLAGLGAIWRHFFKRGGKAEKASKELEEQQSPQPRRAESGRSGTKVDLASSAPVNSTKH